ncbi:DNA-binding SARP family transcriptional activator/tetratricopeptide (TPR) repeat protein [Amycolatopsis lexingtonensis]|uniref:DNA-binding SARP family transcriptional activator/tetratricopeptide (TPR) repeat protein n=1 Tax=Amycolatopsis lexingtonensis TaxID=218822 RepID=A0ABR9ICP9_9PSEU|nr:BTAD domain-containing putative transcriptional regulator [Amycolatopsis lexingtonensis]MBE1500970.1 DNA-binding SARP family transcriptional activator/tetratricopeptide (TPR) repeat protein [Amycolatopsis lexingtonensis]
MSAADGSAPRLQLLGPVKAWSGEVELDLGSAHRRTVLAALAVNPNRTVSREELIDAVWGEAPPQSAQGSIYTYVSGLRRALEPGRAKGEGPQLLASIGSGYSLRLDSGAIDVHRFDALREQALRKQGAGDLRGAREDLEEALGLWHGVPLSGLPGPFAAAQRARLTEVRLATVERRAEVVLESGGHAELVAELTALTREHPFRETLRGLLMRALVRADRRTEAIAVYTDVRDRLVESSGTEPGPALRRLYDQLREKPAAAPEPKPAPLARPARLPVAAMPERADLFVGREAELARLREAVDGLGAGVGRSVWLEGEPGSGRTALLAELLTMAADFTPAFAAADALDQRFALRPLLDALGVHPGAAGHRAVLAARLAEQPGEDPVDGLLALVRELCTEAPLVLVVDDLHWADDATLRVWRYLSRETRQLPLLLVGACRPVPRPAALDELRAELDNDDTTVLVLPPLPESATRELATELVGAPPGPGLQLLVSYAAGNPRYTREIVETLLGQSMIVLDGVHAHLDGNSCHSIPAPLGSRITLYLSFLSSGTRDTLRWAAMLGREFSLSDIAVATERPPTALVGAVDEAIASGVLVESGDRLAFRHALVRRVLYEKTPAAMRVALHRQLAEAFAAAGAPAVRVAEQLAAAPAQVDPWVTTWLLDHIGTVATETPRIAVDLLRHALTQGTLAPDARETLTATLARLLFWLGREPEAEARSVVARTSDSRRAAEMRWILAYVYYRRGDFAEATAELKRTLDDTDVPEMWRGRHESLLATLERLGEETALAPAGLHPLDDAALSVPKLDSLDEAAEPLDAARRIAATRAVPGEMHLAGAVHYYWLGRWPEALEELDAVIRDGAETASYVLRSPGSTLLVHGVGALIAGHRGDPDQARTHLDAADRRQWPPGLEPDGGDFLLAARALLAEQEGRPEAALAALLPLLEENYPPAARHQWLPDLVRLALRLGEPQRAHQALRLLDVDGDAPPAHAAAAAHCRGLVTGDPEPVLTAAGHYRVAGRLLKQAKATEDAAILLAESDRLDEARAAFRGALTAYTGMGAVWDVRRAEGRMQPFGIRRAHAVRSRAAAGE